MADEITTTSHEDQGTAFDSGAFGHEAQGRALAPEPMSAVARLRAFEDERFGADAARVDGKIERGSGSLFAEMSDEDRNTYDAIERLIVAEQKLADAHAALIQADAEHEAAEAAVDG